jgi:type II secretory ATPase GspE/PulE/Tfp pilus assembly ATPase PilB-like protein
MRRLLLVLAVFLFVWVTGSQEAWAQGPAATWRGPGFYLSWLKILGVLVVFFLWVYTTDWVNRDGLELELEYLRWNPIVFGPFMGALVVSWLIPIYWIGLPLVVLAWAVPLGAYVVHRNGRVEDHEKVLTRDHLRYWAAQQLNKLGMKVQAEAPDPHESGVPVVLNARGGGPTERDEAARTLQARQAPGLRAAREIVADGLARRADAIMLDFAQTGVTVRHLVDGVWHNGEPMEREEADPALEALKILCGLNPLDRQSRQEGRFGIDYFVLKQAVFDRMERHKKKIREKLTTDFTRQFSREMARQLAENTPPGQLPPEVNPAELEMRVKVAVEEQVRLKFASEVGPHTPIDKAEVGKLPYTDRPNPVTSLEPVKASATLSTAGTATGERALIQIEGKKARFPSLDSIGMRQKMQEDLKELLGRERGLILFSAMPGQGLRTTTTVVLRTSDRFTREFAAVEEETLRYEPIENIPVTTYKAAAGETPLNVLPDLFHKEPAVVVIRDLVNAETVNRILEEISNNGRLFISSVRAVDAVDAIYRVLAMKVPPSDLAKHLTAVVNQRLIRKLCEHCKEPYAPPAQTLAQLGIPPGRVQAFYRPHQPTEQEEPCPVCAGLGYLGRTAVFELLAVDETVRKALASGAKPDVVRQVARKCGFRGLQEEGIVLVAKGVTSLQELIRVLKQQ